MACKEIASSSLGHYTSPDIFLATSKLPLNHRLLFSNQGFSSSARVARILELSIMTVSNLAQMLYQAAATSSGITVYNDVGLLSSKRTSYKDILAIAAKKANWIKCLPNICCTKVVLLHFASFQENIEWFWAALLTGLLPTISTPLPLDDARRRVHLTHLRNILLHPIILTSSNLAKDFAGVEDIRLEFTNLVSSFKSHDDEDIVDNTASTTAPAALMLTSGSSGNAKAVVLRHEQIIASVKGKSSAFGTTGADVFLNWIGFDHVACVIETHIHAMYLGAELVHVPAPRLVSDPTVFLHLIQTHQVSYTFAPHFFLARLLQNIQDPASREIRFDISCLRHLISGGESNLVETIIALTKALQIYGLRGEVIRPGFGMTETCAGSFYALDSPSYDMEMGNVFASLGKPIAGIQMRVTNADGQGARHGESGDLQVIGSIVFREYFNNLQASRASFTSDGWFVTGDRAYIDAHGNLNIVGREKDSINVNGIKYFPNDIETALESASIPGLTTSYTAVFSHRPAGSHSEEICVVYHPTFDLDDIANRVETASKIVLVVGSLTTCRPKHIIPLPHVLLQKSALGKLSRAKIKATFESGLYGKYEDSRNDKVRSFKAARREVPSTETEHIIWAALQELIDIPEGEAGVSNSIFDFGITSTDLFALKKRFEETLSIPSPVPIGLLLTTPTIRGIANELDALKQSAAGNLAYEPVVPLQNNPSSRKIPLWLIHPVPETSSSSSHLPSSSPTAEYMDYARADSIPALTTTTTLRALRKSPTATSQASDNTSRKVRMQSPDTRSARPLRSR